MESEVLSVLWSVRVALNVATLYLVIWLGLSLPVLITTGTALLFYFIQFIKIQESTTGREVKGKPLIFFIGYASVVNFVLGLPYLINTRSRFLWSIQILVSLISFGLIIGYAFSVPLIQNSYGCYPPEPFYELGSIGVCPQSNISVPTSVKVATCTRLEAEGRFDCSTLPWADTIGASVLHVARTILAVGLGLYASASARCYRYLTAI